MITNNFPEGLPDVEALEKLANQFFSALPGTSPADIGSFDLKNQPVNPGVLPHYDQFNFDQPPAGIPGPYSTGLGNIPLSAAGSGIQPSAVNQFNGVDLPHTHSPLLSPQSIGFGQVPSSLGGVGVSPSVVSHANTIDLRNPQPNLPSADAIGSGNIPSSVAGSGVSPSAIDPGNAVDLKNPQTSLPEPTSTGLGHVPQSVAGSGVSPSAIDHGNAVDLKNPQTSLPDPNSQGLGHVPNSVAGSGISPSAANYTSGAGYNSYLEKVNAYPGLHTKTPLSSDKDFALPSSPGYLPYQPDTPFEADLLEALKNINISAPGQGLSYLPTASIPGTSSSTFYFLNGKERFPPVVNRSQQEIKGNNAQSLDINRIKLDFPILQETVNGHPLVWLDNAATTQKPKQVIDRISYFYEHENSNIHRAAHALAARATDAYEEARKKVQAFLNAGSPNEIVFVRGATEAINLVAKSWGEQNLRTGDEIILSHLEHHANIVPWQQLAAKNGLKIKVIPVDDDGQLLLDEYAKLLGPKTKLVSFSQVSNALGTVTPAKAIIDMAHAAGAKVLVDGAQSVSHMRVDVRALDADWFVFSGHKIFGPTGIGVVYGKEALLNETGPWQGGGNMIKDVTFEYTEYHNAPLRFEAGTGNIADAVGLGAAIDYVSKLGIDLISQYEHYLLVYATNLLKEVPGLRLIGTAPDKASVLSFVLDGFRTDQVGSALNNEGVAVRSGHHCAQPILRRFGVESTVRPSLAFYNTCADVDVLVDVLHRLKK